MIQGSEAVDRAIVRLIGDPDFKTFLQWLEDEKAENIQALLQSQNTVSIHQMQGSAQLLTDILQAVMLAPNAVAARARARNT